ncbi:MAG: hypothetical protein ACT4TC_13500 [Myxococcaceae bacterium]
MPTHFSTFPPCCQKILDLLERENRSGARNCEKGHALQIDWARGVQADAERKAASAAVAAKP